MSEVAPLISDLATILIIAGIITVIFKWLGQPVIVGYIVAGIMAGPSIPDCFRPGQYQDMGGYRCYFPPVRHRTGFLVQKADKCGSLGHILHCYHRLRHDVPGIYGRQCDGLLTHELYLSGRNAVHVLHRHRIQSIQ